MGSTNKATKETTCLDYMEANKSNFNPYRNNFRSNQ